MVIAALLTFGLLLAAWVVAPSAERPPVAAVAAPEPRPLEAAPRAA